MANFIRFFINSTKNYFNLYKNNIAYLKREGFTNRFSSSLTFITGGTAIITGILILLPLMIDRKNKGYFDIYNPFLHPILIPLIHLPLLFIIMFEKVNANNQIKKYRDGANNLIKP